MPPSLNPAVLRALQGCEVGLDHFAFLDDHAGYPVFGQEGQFLGCSFRIPVMAGHKGKSGVLAHGKPAKDGQGDAGGGFLEQRNHPELGRPTEVKPFPELVVPGNDPADPGLFVQLDFLAGRPLLEGFDGYLTVKPEGDADKTKDNHRVMMGSFHKWTGNESAC